MSYWWRYHKLLAQVVAVMLVLSLASPVLAATGLNTGVGQAGNFVPGEIIVKFKDEAAAVQAKVQVQAAYQTLGLTEKRTLPGNAALMKTSASVPEAVKVLNQDPRVEYAQPNFIFRIQAVSAADMPDDPLLEQQWGVIDHVYGVQLPGAWERTQGSEDIIIAVIDTGVDYTHEDLKDNMWVNADETDGNSKDDDGNGYVDDIRGWDFIGEDAFVSLSDNDPMDVDGHGTHVAGIIAAEAYNDKGIVGVAPGAKVMALKALDDNGIGTTDTIVEAIHYAAKNGARVVNMSFGGVPNAEDPTADFCPLTYEAIKSYPDILFVAAAGNEANNNDSLPVYPACYTVDNWVDTNNDGTKEYYPALPNIISVAALDRTGNLASFSNYGANSVNLVAPGELIVSTVPSAVYAGGYIAWDGTSMAAPFVSGGAGLALSLNNSLSPNTLIDLFENQVTKLNVLDGQVAAGGTLNIEKVLDSVPLDTTPPAVIATSPANGTVNVAVNTNIIVTFSESVVKGVYFDDIAVKAGETVVDNVYKILSDNTLELNPSDSLSYGTKYTVTLPAESIEDNAGNTLAGDYTFSFTTQSVAAGGGGGGGGGGGAAPAPAEPQSAAEAAVGAGAEVVAAVEGKAVLNITAEAAEEGAEITVKFGTKTPGQVTLGIPAGALPEGTKLTVKLMTETTEKVPGGAMAVAPVISLETTDDLAKPIKVAIRFDTARLKGLDARKLMVFRENADGTWEAIGGKLDRAKNAVVVELGSFSNYTVFGVTKTFNDVEGHWAQQNVELLAARGLVKGISDKQFAPNQQVTRAEMAALLVRLSGVTEAMPANPTFTDVNPGAWYYGAVEAAVKAGLVSGYDDGTFRPDKPLTREQMAAMIVNLVGKAAATPQLPFDDYDAVSAWAKKSVTSAYAKGLLRGVSDTQFVPKMLVTRAQAAAVTARLAEKMGLFEVTSELTGKLVWREISKPHWELDTGKEKYVLLPIAGDKETETLLKMHEGNRVTVIGYLQTEPNIYMRGPLVKVLTVTPAL